MARSLGHRRSGPVPRIQRARWNEMHEGAWPHSRFNFQLEPLLMHVARSLALLSAVLSPARGVSQSQPLSPARVTGEWTFVMDGDRQPQRVDLLVEGDTVRGRVYGQAFAGTLRGSRLTFAVGDYRWRGTLRGDTLTGWLGVGNDSSTWRAQRFVPPAAARVFDHTPREYHRALSATVTPALRLFPGDTVHTTTVDAGGWGRGAFGADGNKLSAGGNPLTGPFYVDGTVPGDVLAVTLHRVRLNRAWAFSGTSIIDNALEVEYASGRKGVDIDNKWILDTTTGTARLTTPPPALTGLRIPLTPFLGVVAVAPGDGVVPSSRDSGPFGGNMENAFLHEGTTIYLPVTELGAYLYIGDGHAAQGAGELTGDAMETTMDVTFSVHVQRWRFASVPRAENAQYIMSMGIGGSMDEAMRRATSDLARWLETDYVLTSNEAAVVMGFAIVFDVPDVVMPGIGVSVRLPKSVLAGLTKRR